MPASMPAMETAMKRAERSADDAARSPVAMSQRKTVAKPFGDPDDPGDRKCKEHDRDKGENTEIPRQSPGGYRRDRCQDGNDHPCQGEVHQTRVTDNAQGNGSGRADARGFDHRRGNRLGDDSRAFKEIADPEGKKKGMIDRA